MLGIYAIAEGHEGLIDCLLYLPAFCKRLKHSANLMVEEIYAWASVSRTYM